MSVKPQVTKYNFSNFALQGTNGFLNVTVVIQRITSLASPSE
jgi:hypothetical protein